MWGGGGRKVEKEIGESVKERQRGRRGDIDGEAERNMRKLDV